MVCTSRGHPDTLTHGLWTIDRYGGKKGVSPAAIARHCVLLRIVRLLESGALKQAVTFNFENRPYPKFSDVLVRDEEGKEKR